jgi:hypothetical protein
MEVTYVFTKAEPSTNRIFCGMSIDLIDEKENTPDSMLANREFDSNEMDMSDSQCEKHDEPRLSTYRGIMID